MYKRQIFTYVGPQAVALLGYPAEDWLQKGYWEEVVHPDDRNWVRMVRGEALAKRESFECEYRMVGATSRVVKVREMVSVLSADDGTPILGGFLLDVTNRWIAEEALKESRHFIEQIASASPTISYLYDLQHQNCIYANGRVGDILGVTKNTLIDMQPLFFVALGHPSEAENHVNHFEQVRTANNDEVLGREFRLRSASGEWIWVFSRECIFKREASGEPIQVVGTLEDITEARHTTDELEANEARFRKLAESARVIPFEFNMGLDRFTYVGPQAEAILGIPVPSDFSSENWRSILHPSDIYEGTRFAHAESCDDSPDFETEFRIRAGRGKVVWVRQFAHCSTGGNGDTRVTGFLFDVTETKRIQQEHDASRTKVRELTARGHQSREEERRSIARELHDELGQALTLLKLDLSWLDGRIRKMNRPKTLAGRPSKTLLVTSSIVEVVRRDESLLSACTSKVEEMEKRLDSTLNMLRRVLSALRPPLLDELGLADAIEFHATEFAKRTGLRCDLRIQKDLQVPIDVSLAIFRIFQEVTTNIAKHAQAGRVRITLEHRIGTLVLAVSDDGVGINPSLEDGRHEHFGLLGIRERAWAFGGQVNVGSASGKGTEVQVEIPIPAGDVRHHRPGSTLDGNSEDTSPAMHARS